MLGYFILADQQVLVTLDKQRFWLIGLFAGATVATISFAHGFQQAVSWLGVLALLGLARHYWNTSGPLTKYLSQASFGLYLFHQSWIVIVAFSVFRVTTVPVLQILLILPVSVILTFITYEICSRFRITAWLFGLKQRA